MFVLAHAAHWLEATLLAPPAAVVVASIARSVKARRVHATKEEATR